jgi:hypothetical protein
MDLIGWAAARYRDLLAWVVLVTAIVAVEKAAEVVLFIYVSATV